MGSKAHKKGEGERKHTIHTYVAKTYRIPGKTKNARKVKNNNKVTGNNRATAQTTAEEEFSN